MNMSVPETRVARRYRHRIIPALLVIAIGTFFLLGNLGIDFPLFDYANWWAWFILIGAAWPLFDAVDRYRSTGTVDGEVLRSLLTAAVIVMVALMFILELSWQRWWPVFIIYGGLCMLVRDPRRNVDDHR
jgi:drug/metabolite transporter (DMT)-like permease